MKLNFLDHVIFSQSLSLLFLIFFGPAEGAIQDVEYVLPLRVAVVEFVVVIDELLEVDEFAILDLHSVRTLVSIQGFDLLKVICKQFIEEIILFDIDLFPLFLQKFIHDLLLQIKFLQLFCFNQIAILLFALDLQS